MDSASLEPRTYDIDASAISAMEPALRDTYWPLAGLKLTPELREKWELPSEEQEKQGVKPRVNAVRIPNTHHDYSISHGYLVPYYSLPKAALAHRSESRIIGRSRAWIMNAEPQLNINRTEEEIGTLYSRFISGTDTLDERDANGMNVKCNEFRQFFGAVMSRFEQLGRAIEQGNTFGSTKIAFSQPSGSETPEVVNALNKPQIDQLRAEYTKYYRMLMKPKFLPLMRLVRFHDMQIDFDGALIDWMREIGKPLRVERLEQEYENNRSITLKIGDAMHSIDQVHDALKKAMTVGESGALFTRMADDFIKTHGAEYGIHRPADILRQLDDYAVCCRARCGIQSDDARGFDSLYPRYAAIENFFNDPGGFLQTVRHRSRESQDMGASLRFLITRGIKLMTRVSSTHIPCNANAPEIWIPNFDNADPIEAHMAKNLLTEPEKKHVMRCLKAAEHLPAVDREHYLQQQFCSLGQLEAGFRSLEETLEKKQARRQPAGH